VNVSQLRPRNEKYDDHDDNNNINNNNNFVYRPAFLWGPG
jgi:hypothetical protein